MRNTYLDLVASFGIGGAHPGGFSLTKSILKDENIQPNDTVLDIGCGTGQTAAFLAQRFQCQVTAVDNHPTMIRKARERFESNDLSITVLEGDAQNIKLMDNSFDLIIAESVISFTTISKTLNELSRVLKSGGRLILIEMAAEQSLSEEVRNKVSSLYGIHEILNEHEWKSKLQQAGFTQIEIIETPSGLIQTDIHDSNQSENINADLYDLWDEHDRFITQNHDVIGFRAFRCQLI
ncbi:methyltransferase domain-containing protein [Sporosarcina sp. Marseille-Q4063]|uniref:class I SAM-dependent methyltransferase n=1 Tax=Sporosarcina sp. Marseille-Q4063 TaxID=2810514 RepID=UPI001BAF9E4C|nr:class I SAM-dependent methyltransferase [Sporosarcina sp. Marseille-Q4063]QUW23549.1 methyltransferase domain-containing protein [Sporosarcina sp. Marseille-Q4063]